MILSLPLEIIDYISDFLPFQDRYQFAKTNSIIYQIIWKPIDISHLFDLLIYSSEINFYGTLFSDNPKDWINHSFVFTIADQNFTLGYYYQEPHLHLKIYKLFKSNQFNKEPIQKINQLGWIHQPQNSQDIFFQKKIGFLSEGYSLLFDQIHKNIQSILEFFQARPYFPIYKEKISFSNPDEMYIDILYDDLCQLSLHKNKSYARDEISSTYYTNVWDERIYNYLDQGNLIIANEIKQKTLSESIHQILHQLRLTELNDKKTLRKIASHFTTIRNKTRFNGL
jgi:hypothetical protein